MEEKMEYYYKLGRILHKYYNGELLNREELELMAKAENDDYKTALDFNAMERLSRKTDRSLENLLRNQTTLKFINLELISNEKTR